MGRVDGMGRMESVQGRVVMGPFKLQLVGSGLTSPLLGIRE